MRKRLSLIVLIPILVLIVTGCNVSMDGDLEQNSDTSIDSTAPGSSALRFNLSGAKAIGSAEIGASARNLRGTSLTGSRDASQSTFGLVKVLEDGSIEMAMEAPENVWLPNLMFIALSPDPEEKDLFVAFEQGFQFWDSETQEDVRIGSFLHIEEDGTYYSIKNDEGRVKNYSWYGTENYKPITFDGDGNVYFVWESWTAGNNVEILYRYNPRTHESIALTPALSGYHYHDFKVSPDGQRLFLRGERDSWSGGSASKFFRMFNVNNISEPKTVFYSSSQDVWVRGFIISPDGSSIIMNGQNIRGFSGIQRIDIISDTELDYAPLFDSNTDTWFSPQYSSWYSDWENKTYHRGFFNYIGQYDSYVLLTDGVDFRYGRLSDVLSYSCNYAINSYEALGGQGSWDFKLGHDLHFATDMEDPGIYKVIDPSLDGPDPDDPAIISTPYSRLTEVDKESLIFGYNQRTWINGSEESEFIPFSWTIAEDVNSNGSVYVWNDYWYDEVNNSLNYDAIEDYLAGYFINDFTFSFSDVTGLEAWDAFYQQATYSQTELYGSPTNDYHFLNNYFLQEGTLSPATTFKEFRESNNLNWLNFQDISSLFYDSSNNLWGITGGSYGGSSPVKPIRLLDGEGKKSLAIIESLDESFKPVGFLIDGDSMYFRDAVTDLDGFETGYHKLYSMNLTDTNPVPRDVLTDLGEKNGKIEIVDFSVGNGFIYFTAVDGITLIGGKIHTETFEFTPFNSDYVVKNIEVY